jgi:hypothetical protein
MVSVLMLALVMVGLTLGFSYRGDRFIRRSVQEAPRHNYLNGHAVKQIKQ